MNPSASQLVLLLTKKVVGKTQATKETCGATNLMKIVFYPSSKMSLLVKAASDHVLMLRTASQWFHFYFVVSGISKLGTS